MINAKVSLPDSGECNQHTRGRFSGLGCIYICLFKSTDINTLVNLNKFITICLKMHFSW